MHLEFFPTHTTSTHPLQVSSPHEQNFLIYYYTVVLIHNEIGKGSTNTLNLITCQLCSLQIQNGLQVADRL